MPLLSKPFFALHPYVFLVEGACRGALYDLHSKRLYPIPEAAKYVVSLCERGTAIADILSQIEGQGDRQTALEYLRRLTEMDFGCFRDSLDTLEKTHLHLSPMNRTRLINLDVEFSLSRDADLGPSQLLDLVDQAKRMQVDQLLLKPVRVPQAVESGALLDLLQRVQEIFPGRKELWLPEADLTEDWLVFLQASRTRIVIPEEASRAGEWLQGLRSRGLPSRIQRMIERRSDERNSAFNLDESKLRIGLGLFRYWKSFNPNGNRLSIRVDGRVFPCLHEEAFCLGEALKTPLTKLVESPRVQFVWTLTKDRIEKCRECEFRFACPNPQTFRSRPDDYDSAPLNCRYDPAKGVWEQPASVVLQFRRAAQEDRPAEGIERDETRYFRILSHASRPHPPDYARLLDQSLEQALRALDIPAPERPITYFFYPERKNLEELGAQESSYCGVMEAFLVVGGGFRYVVHTTYPCHTHEVMHALLHAVSQTGSYFVQESAATMFNMCRGLPSDVERAAGDGEDLRIVDARSGRVREDVFTVYDEVGLPFGALARHSSPHPIAAHILERRPHLGRLQSFFDAKPGALKGVPYYEIGGSFFRYLLDKQGAEKFRAYYQSPQSPDDLERIYGVNLNNLERRWRRFLGGVPTAANVDYVSDCADLQPSR